MYPPGPIPGGVGYQMPDPVLLRKVFKALAKARKRGLLIEEPTRPESAYEGQATNWATGETLDPWQSPEFAEVRERFTNVEAPRGELSWGLIRRGAIGYYESLAFVLNKHLGWSTLGRRYLQDIVDGLDEEASVRRAVEYLRGEGSADAEALRGPEPSLEDVEELANQGVGMARHYTGASEGYEDAGKIAEAAREDRLTPEALKGVPERFLPERIAGLGEPEQD